MTPAPLNELWVYLATSPLLGLTLTLLAYQAAHHVYQRSGQHPLANPVLIAVAILGSLLWLSDTAYETYFAGAQFVHFLLGPATVALAVPLYTHFRQVRRLLGPLTLALLAGSSVAIVSAVLIARALGASAVTQASLAPKSVTTPIAMGIAEKIGGLPSLTAVLVIFTGILGAALGPALLRRAGLRDPAGNGFAMGIAAHGVGTARAFQLNEQSGAFAALAMGLNGLFTAVLLPAVAHWLL